MNSKRVSHKKEIIFELIINKNIRKGNQLDNAIKMIYRSEAKLIEIYNWNLKESIFLADLLNDGNAFCYLFCSSRGTLVMKF